MPYTWAIEPLCQLTPELIREELMPVEKDMSMTAAQLKVLILDHAQEYGDLIALYTDGSKSAEGTGCASIKPAKRRRAELNSNASVFTAELYSILKFMEDIEKHAGRRYTEFKDSQNAINSYGIFHPLIYKLQKWLVQIVPRDTATTPPLP